MWDFSKLPKTEYETVKELYLNKNIVGLIKIHNQYKLSNYDYGCCPAKNMEKAILNYYKLGIESNFEYKG